MNSQALLEDEAHKSVCKDKNTNSTFKQFLHTFSLFHHAFQLTIHNGPTNALVCNEILIQMSQTKTFKITPTCFDHQMIIIRELSDPG
jgi:predicted O-linked N-acetylglucosamine transferase (SPINDLY family)